MSRERGPWTDRIPQSFETSSIETSRLPASDCEVREVGLGGRQEVLVLGDVEQDAVLDDEPTVVAPQRVLRLADEALRRVAGEDAAEEAPGIGAGEPVLVQRRRVEQAGRVPDREVLELLGHLVAHAPPGGPTSAPTDRSR